jgi:hypothetical protein
MANVVVVGAQWGDEGKGKIVDWLSERADVICRFQGGHKTKLGPHEYTPAEQLNVCPAECPPRPSQI